MGYNVYKSGVRIADVMVCSPSELGSIGVAEPQALNCNCWISACWSISSSMLHWKIYTSYIYHHQHLPLFTLTGSSFGRQHVETLMVLWYAHWVDERDIYWKPIDFSPERSGGPVKEQIVNNCEHLFGCMCRVFLYTVHWSRVPRKNERTGELYNECCKRLFSRCS